MTADSARQGPLTWRFSRDVTTLNSGGFRAEHPRADLARRKPGVQIPSPPPRNVPGHRPGGSLPPGRRRPRAPGRAANGQQPRRNGQPQLDRGHDAASICGGRPAVARADQAAPYGMRVPPPVPLLLAEDACSARERFLYATFKPPSAGVCGDRKRPSSAPRMRTSEASDEARPECG